MSGIDTRRVWLIKALSGLGLLASLLALSLNSRTILRQNPGAASDPESGLKTGDFKSGTIVSHEGRGSGKMTRFVVFVCGRGAFLSDFQGRDASTFRDVGDPPFLFGLP